jgi:hypothetical protein
MSKKTDHVTIKLVLPVEQADALAEMCKRIIYEEIRRMSASEKEHWEMDAAISTLRGALSDAGFAPR